MNQQQADKVLRKGLDALGVTYVAMPEYQCYVAVDRHGHQVEFSAYEGPFLDPEMTMQPPVLTVSTVLLADIDVPFPERWRDLLRLGDQFPFAKLTINGGNQLTVAVELFAEFTSPSELLSAMLTVSMLADRYGDEVAEHFEGQRVFWKRGRTSAAA